jgi:hypothetical protein
MSNILQETMESLTKDFVLSQDPWLKSLEEAIAEAEEKRKVEEEASITEIKEIIEDKELKKEEKIEELQELLSDVEDKEVEKKDEEIEEAIEIAEESCSLRLMEFDLMCMEHDMSSMSTEEEKSGWFNKIKEFIKKIIEHIKKWFSTIWYRFQLWLFKSNDSEIVKKAVDAWDTSNLDNDNELNIATLKTFGTLGSTHSIPSPFLDTFLKDLRRLKDDDTYWLKGGINYTDVVSLNGPEKEYPLFSGGNRNVWRILDQITIKDISKCLDEWRKELEVIFEKGDPDTSDEVLETIKIKAIGLSEIVNQLMPILTSNIQTVVNKSKQLLKELKK